MNRQKEIIPQVFSSLMSLEKKLEIIKTQAPKKGSQALRFEQNIFEQAKILKRMRKIANLLQFAVAHKNQVEISKQLKIYSALNQMVKPEIQTSLHDTSKSRQKVIFNAH